MKYLVEFRIEAQKDILEATAWYEKNREGLGDDAFNNPLKYTDPDGSIP